MGQMEEINNLINNYSNLPSLDNEYTLISGNELVLDINLNNIKVEGENYRIENNKLIINPTIENEYTYTLEKEDNIYNKPYIFYQTSNSQNLIETGNIPNSSTYFKVNVIKTEIELNKVDKDTKYISPKGEASLDGAIYSLYDENNNLIDELTIENNKSIINNISLGKYYIKENKPGIGYQLDTNTYEIEISKDNYKQQLTLENKVIEKTITIEKKYGDTNILKGEKDISFDIYNSNNEKIATITTNNLGIATITLPYGEYTLKQINTTEGYKKVDDFIIKVNNTDDEVIELKDLRIEVPNTSTNNHLLLLIIKFLLTLW
jgi:hypothetical protein